MFVRVYFSACRMTPNNRCYRISVISPNEDRFSVLLPISSSSRPNKVFVTDPPYLKYVATLLCRIAYINVEYITLFDPQCLVYTALLVCLYLESPMSPTMDVLSLVLLLFCVSPYCKTFPYFTNSYKALNKLTDISARLNEIHPLTRNIH